MLTYPLMTVCLSCFLAMLVVAAPALPSDPRTYDPSNKRAIYDVCKTLRQSEGDIGMCCDKARGNTITAGETASLVYLCCLGYFRDVQHSYMDKITFPMLIHIVQTSNPEELRNEAKFIVGCQDTQGGPLGVEDYVRWRNGPKRQPYCRA